MKVNRGNGQSYGPENARPTNRVEADASATRGRKKSDRRSVPPQDSVEISSAGRSRAAKLHGTDALTPERVSEIRRRILEGAYSTDAVVHEVAQRILASGDL